MRIKKVLAALLGCCALMGGAIGKGEGAMYEIFPSSFYDGNGDGVGDLAGIMQKIAYLEELGVEGVWLTPIHPSPSYHRYDVMAYCDVDPLLGTVEDVQLLAGALHEKEMSLVLDLVINHSSSEHPWFIKAVQSLASGEESPYTEYYNFSNESVPGWHPVPGAEGWCYEGCFAPNMPDLNLDSLAVREEILSICKFWLDKGVDGFRLDAVLFYYNENTQRNTAFLTWLMDSLRSIKSDVYVIGELWKDAATIANHYGSGISSFFNFPFAGPDGAIVKAIREQKGQSFANKAVAWQQVWHAYEGAADAAFLSNHDIARIAGTLMGKAETQKLAASLYLLLPGTPYVYYGEEIGMTGSGRDENKRLPMIWHEGEANRAGDCLPPLDADQTASSLGSVEVQMADANSLLVHYQALLAARKAHSALRDGVMETIETEEAAVCAYRLFNEEETLYIAHNVSGEEVLFSWAYEPLIRLNDPQDGVAAGNGSMVLPPYATVICMAESADL